MVVEIGYKQTEVGVIPNDWNIKPIGEISTVYSGGTPKTEIRGYYGGNINFLTSGDLNKNRIYDVEGKITEIGLINSSAKMVKSNTLLIAMYGATAGVCAITEIEAAINQAILAVMPQKDNKEYIFYWWQLHKDKLVFTLTQGGQPNLSGSLIKSVQIPLPPLPEQTAIATALSDMDALIAKTEQLIEKKKAIKQGLMQELLTGRTRLPGFENKKEYRHTEVGVIPEDWEVVSLGSCLLKNPEYGINAPAVPFNYNLPTYLRITDISEDGKFITQNKVSVNHLLAPNYYLKIGDMVFARTGASVGKTYLYKKSDGKLVYAGFLIRVTPNENKLSVTYLFQITKTKRYADWVLANSMRSGQPGINGNEYKSLMIILPPLPEQIAIAEALSAMDENLTLLDAKLQKLKLQKQGMMQALLTGKIRLV